MRSDILILGASGMLGSMVVDYLSRNKSFHVTATVRTHHYLDKLKATIKEVDWQLFSVKDNAETVNRFVSLGRFDWIINAIGIIKPYARDDQTAERENAIKINALFPYWLATATEKNGSKILQIATDCVYSGNKGHYVESDKHDALDVYGKTKSLGESPSDSFHHLRCSIVGPEIKSFLSLQEWFLRQPDNAQVNGYSNHMWNGLTTLHFAKICEGIITSGISLPKLQHIIPSGEISKNSLLNKYASVYERQDIQITAIEAPTIIDRTLKTENHLENTSLWKVAGYPGNPPTVEEMVEELGAFNFRLKEVLL